jgi:hypothetical protein
MAQRQNHAAIVPYGQGGDITIDVNHDGFADGGVHGAPSVAVIDTSQSQSVWVWLKVFPSLIRHQWFTVIIALCVITVAIPTVLHIIAAILRPDARYLEAKDGGAAGNLAPWVWSTNMVTAIKQPVSNTAKSLQDAAIDSNADTRAMSASLKSQTKVNIQ